MTFLDFLPQSKTDAVANVIAVAMVASPAWIETLNAWHAALAVVLQIAGLAFLGFRAWIMWREKKK